MGDSIRPCTYPNCGGRDSDPALTGLGMCEHCQAQFARLLGRLVVDWVNLATNLPTPAQRARERRSSQQVYGHPAEWASDTAAEIATVLNETHDALADYLIQSPAPHPGTGELVRVRAAWNFLECRIPDLAMYPGGEDAAIEMIDLHGKIRSRLGLNRARQILPTPCPSCELRTLFRSVDAHTDSIECGACGHVIREDHYPFYTRLVLDTILSSEPAA
ncbi:hypothetical protein ACIP5Y_21685 [Nocardia sp. NPDC088792]|uniref:hypothetical protein n=1 Tax=Nocardia sp. NPDC088792 TaxID=3364332 RepID=UPI003809C9DF